MFGIEVNYVAVVISAVLAMVIGFFWYSKSLFGKEWSELVDFTEEKEQKAKVKMPITFALSAVSFLVMAYVLTHIISFINATTLFEGVQAGFLMWAGFVATTMLINILYQGKKIKLFFIDSFYQLIVLLVMGGVLVVL